MRVECGFVRHGVERGRLVCLFAFLFLPLELLAVQFALFVLELDLPHVFGPVFGGDAWARGGFVGAFGAIGLLGRDWLECGLRGWFGGVTLRGGGAEDGVGGSAAGFAAGGGIVFAFDKDGEAVECAASGAEGEDAGAELLGAGDASEELSRERGGACVEHTFDGLTVRSCDATDRVGLVEEVVENSFGELVESELLFFGLVGAGIGEVGGGAHGSVPVEGEKKRASTYGHSSTKRRTKTSLCARSKWG